MEELSLDKNLSHYRIVSKIGAGGMGDVYLAQDRLSRKVALKILPADLAADHDLMRQAYQEFFEVWKDADADIPILIEAKNEYERLK